MPVTQQQLQNARAVIGGADLAPLDGLDVDKVLELLEAPFSFFAASKLLGEDDFVDFATPTPAQLQALEAAFRYRWLLIDKYRQAKMTSCLAIGVLLRDCMYGNGLGGVVIAHDTETSEMVFERVLYAYDTLPDCVKMPLSSGRQKGARHISFCHGGSIKVLTMGSRAPGVGRGVSRILITEIGESPQQRRMMVNLFPTFNKRPNARVIVESTPGRSGSPHEHLWRKSIEGAGRFHPLFLEWWRDDSCRAAVPPDETFEPTIEERVYAAKHPDITPEHLYFRRLALENEFVGEPRLFGSKYPSDPYDGWVGSLNPVMPADVIKGLLAAAERDADVADRGYGCWEIEEPDEKRPYLITDDPAGFGLGGDPSALTVWDAIDQREVAFWEGREDPGRHADRLMRVQQRYAGNDTRGALLAVESNAAACIGILRDRGCPRLLWTNRRHPGWYATGPRLLEAEARLVKLLRDNDLIVRSVGTLHQLLDYDGSRRDERRKSDNEDEVHHFDRARTCVIAADVLNSRKFHEDVDEPVKQPRQPGTLPFNLIRDKLEQGRARAKSPFRPPPRY